MKLRAVCIVFLFLLANGWSNRVAATSYQKASLRDLVARAQFVALVDVLSSRVVMDADAQFPRTLYKIVTRQTLAGKAPQEFELNVPGGRIGDQICAVSDGVELTVGQAAVLFAGADHPLGGYCALDLGLGAFHVRERNGARFVESLLCQQAIAKDARHSDETTFLFRSIPVNDFVSLVAAFARGETPALPFENTKLRATSSTGNIPIAVANFSAGSTNESTDSIGWLLIGFATGMAAVLAVVVVRIRRARRAKNITTGGAWILFLAAMLVGALSGSAAHAFVASGPNAVWNLDRPLPGRVADGKVIWHASTAISKTNSRCFEPVRFAFNKWDNVPGARIGFSESNLTGVSRSLPDSINIVAWSTTPGLDYTSNVLAACYTRAVGGEKPGFVDCDIIFNDQDFDWSPGGRGNISAVALHEIGHFIGLGHTSDENTVMFPSDKGLVALSDDEEKGAQALYPGTNGAILPTDGPSATLFASPAAGMQPLPVSLSALVMLGDRGAKIVSYTWDFGDGSDPEETLLPEITHVYGLRGLYNAKVIARDELGNPAYASQLISVNAQALVEKATVNLSFSNRTRGSIYAVLQSESAKGTRGTQGIDQFLPSTVFVSSLERHFTFNTYSGKTVEKTGPQVRVQFGTGRVTVRVNDLDLPVILSQLGLSSQNAETLVPIGVRIGLGQNLVVTGTAKLSVKKSSSKALQATLK